jgi:hypothetical protein
MRHGSGERHVALALALLLGGATGVRPEGYERPDLAGSHDVPVLRDLRYQMSAAVRPLPLLPLWMGDSDVGAARIIWRGDENGRRGYELLIGSDPLRAPRKINRWGWAREDMDENGARMMGLMRKTDEQSYEEARAQVDAEGKGSTVFKSIRTRVVGSTTQAENSVWLFDEDYTYRDLAEVRRLVSSLPPAPPKIEERRLPDGTRPGFLFAAADLVREAIAAARGEDGRPPTLISDRTVVFTFNATLYDLTLRSTRREESAEYGGRRYENLLRMEFEHYNRKLRTRERFTLVCGTEGSWARVPVYVKYQPKWWFKAEGVLDETETF